MNTAPIISKVWSFCTTLRDDRFSYGDYLEQLTYVIFLKMAENPAPNKGLGDSFDLNGGNVTCDHTLFFQRIRCG